MFYIFVNFKTYPQASNAAAVKLAHACFKVDQQFSRVKIISVVQALDAWRVKQEDNASPWLQHLDAQEPGRSTGWVTLETALGAGVAGVLLNHSEHSLPPGTAKQIIARIRQAAKQDFQVMVCAKTLGQVERWSRLKTDFLAFEVAALIGTGRSITDQQPKAISKAQKICQSRDCSLVVGAGISSPADVVKAKELGATGVLVSSAIVKAKNPGKKLKSFAERI